VSSKSAATVYDIDLFDVSEAQIATLKQQGRRVICYFSAGSSENWRPDFSKFLAADTGRALDGWAGEKWLDTRSANVRAIMAERMDLAARKGCTGVDPDNVDGYTNSTGFPLSASTQLDYNRFLAAAAHARGLVIGLKNDVDQLSVLASDFDFAVNEQCNEYSECKGYSAFIALGKPVLNIEYKRAYQKNTNGAFDKMCATSRATGLYSVVMPLALDGSFIKSCR
jgi:hypothetical protein